jgi:hypothetical protein
VVPGRECAGRNVISPQKPIADASGLNPTHGGLTPAALGNVRLYSANIVFHSERTSCTRSGWRKPAVVPGRECAGRNVISPQKPIADASANATHGGLTPAALGNVGLYSANIVFHSERASCNQERLA